MPVLVITGYAERKMIVEAAQNGISGFIVKPFKGVDLVEKVKQILGGASLEQDEEAS